MDPVEAGNACGSDTAHLSILGYDPRKYYRGRGAFESMGSGLEMAPGDIAFKSNFATLDPTTNIVVSRRADRHFEHLGPTLCAFLTGISLPSFSQHRVDVQYATEHRCGVRVRGPGLTDNISSTDPLKDNLPLLEALPTDETKEAQMTAKLVNELSTQIHKALEPHPINEERRKQGKPVANVVLLRGCGTLIEAPTFYQRHQLNPFLIAPTCIIAGLAMSLGFDIVKAPGATGDYQTNLKSKGQTLVDTFLKEGSEYTFGFIHVKAVDDAGHDRNVGLKVHFLQEIDRMVGNILTQLAAAEKDPEKPTEFTILVTGDHSTPVLTGDHSYEPVPFAISKVRNATAVLKKEDRTSFQHMADSTLSFDEISTARGLLGRFCGGQVMTIAKNYMNL